MKLFLTSSCVTENLADRFLQMCAKNPKEVKFYFIPTATDVEDNKTYTVKSLDDFAKLGINPIWYSLRFKTKELIAQELSGADVIWVGGGNTFYLLDMARQTGFFEVVDHLVRQKGIIYGGTSAGTIIATPSIDIAGWGDNWDRNNVGIKDFTGLGFVDFLTHVHYQPGTEKDMLLSKKTNRSIYAIPDGGAVVVEDDKVETLGGVEML